MGSLPTWMVDLYGKLVGNIILWAIYLVAIQIRLWTMIFYSQKWCFGCFPVTKPTRWKILQTKISRISPALIREITFSEPLPKWFTWVPSVSPKKSRLPSKIAPGPWGTQVNPSFFGGVCFTHSFWGLKKNLTFSHVGVQRHRKHPDVFFCWFRGLIHFFGEGSYPIRNL